MTHPLLPKNLNKTNALFRQGPPDYTKEALDSFPAPTAAEAGATLEDSDTGDRYRWTGGNWTTTHIRGIPVGISFNFEVAIDRIEGLDSKEAFGDNIDIDIVSGDEVIWDGGGVYVPPTVARVHNVASSSASDAGVLVSTGAITAFDTSGPIELTDTSATFIADGVTVGDLIINDTDASLSFVASIVSETALQLVTLFRDPIKGTGLIGGAEIGDAYRIIRELGGTGAAVIFIEGHSSGRVAQHEWLILNGLSNVPTVNSYQRISRVRVFGSIGATGALGNITGIAVTDLTTTFIILAGNNQTLMAIDTVNANTVAFITKWWGSLSKKGSADVQLKLHTGLLDGIDYTVQVRSISGSGNSSFEYEFPVPIAIGAASDIWIEANTDTNNVGVSGGFSLLTQDLP